jgi:hypothetical protein
MSPQRNQQLVVGLYSGENSSGSVSFSGQETRRVSEVAARTAQTHNIGSLVLVGLRSEEMAINAEEILKRESRLYQVPDYNVGRGDLTDDLDTLKTSHLRGSNFSRLFICTPDYLKETTEYVAERVFGDIIDHENIEYPIVDTKGFSRGTHGFGKLKREARAYKAFVRFNLLLGLEPEDDMAREDRIEAYLKNDRARKIVKKLSKLY